MTHQNTWNRQLRRKSVSMTIEWVYMETWRLVNQFKDPLYIRSSAVRGKQRKWGKQSFTSPFFCENVWPQTARNQVRSGHFRCLRSTLEPRQVDSLSAFLLPVRKFSHVSCKYMWNDVFSFKSIPSSNVDGNFLLKRSETPLKRVTVNQWVVFWRLTVKF